MADDAIQNVYVIDDDEQVRETIVAMLEVLDYTSRSFPDGRNFLQSWETLTPGIIVLDVNMPELSGLQVLNLLAEKNCDWPIVVMSGEAGIEMAVEAMKRGACDFIEKPATIGTVERVIKDALKTTSHSDGRCPNPCGSSDIEELLTPREFEVLRKLLGGRQNKEVGRELNISHRTVEIHRGNLMRRLKVENFAELIQVAISHGVKAS